MKKVEILLAAGITSMSAVSIAQQTYTGPSALNHAVLAVSLLAVIVGINFLLALLAKRQTINYWSSYACLVVVTLIGVVALNKGWAEYGLVVMYVFAAFATCLLANHVAKNNFTSHMALFIPSLVQVPTSALLVLPRWRGDDCLQQRYGPRLRSATAYSGVSNLSEFISAFVLAMKECGGLKCALFSEANEQLASGKSLARCGVLTIGGSSPREHVVVHDRTTGVCLVIDATDT